MRRYSEEFGPRLVSGVWNMSIGSLPIARGIKSVDNEGTLGSVSAAACVLSVLGVYA